MTSTILVVSLSALYLVLCKLVSDGCAGWLRPQLARLLGMRKSEWYYIDKEPVGLVYPLRWYEQILWPFWLLPVIGMRILGFPKRTTPTRDA